MGAGAGKVMKVQIKTGGKVRRMNVDNAAGSDDTKRRRGHLLAYD